MENSMGVIIPPPNRELGKPPLPPYPPNDPRWKEQDRFGLPIWPPSLLSETADHRRARIAMVEALAVDLFRTAVAHLGRKEAQILFANVAKEHWKRGKQPNRERNKELLEMYDSAVGKAPKDIRSIPRLLAKKLHPDNPRSAPAAEKQIRRLVRDRARKLNAMEEQYRQFPPSPLAQAKASHKDK
jgi:hypothetical protein